MRYVGLVESFTGKVALEESLAHPLCPWCQGPLDLIHWHKIRGGPMLVPYVLVLSCAVCRGVLDVLAGGGNGGGAAM